MEPSRQRLSIGDVTPVLGVGRNALRAPGLELQVLLARERAEGAGVQPGAPLAVLDVEGLAVAGDLTGERDVRPEQGDQRRAPDGGDETTEHTHALLDRSKVGLAIGRTARIGRPFLETRAAELPRGSRHLFRPPILAQRRATRTPRRLDLVPGGTARC